jgi:hypothetical protein
LSVNWGHATMARGRCQDRPVPLHNDQYRIPTPEMRHKIVAPCLLNRIGIPVGPAQHIRKPSGVASPRTSTSGQLCCRSPALSRLAPSTITHGPARVTCRASRPAMSAPDARRPCMVGAVSSLATASRHPWQHPGAAECHPPLLSLEPRYQHGAVLTTVVLTPAFFVR